MYGQPPETISNRQLRFPLPKRKAWADPEDVGMNCQILKALTPGFGQQNAPHQRKTFVL